MTVPANDLRDEKRRTLDEQIAAEPNLPAPQLPAKVVPLSVESHLSGLRREPLAMAGIVENGLIRPLNPAITLPEHSRVIIVMAEVSRLERTLHR